MNVKLGQPVIADQLGAKLVQQDLNDWYLLDSLKTDTFF